MLTRLSFFFIAMTTLVQGSDLGEPKDNAGSNKARPVVQGADPLELKTKFNLSPSLQNVIDFIVIQSELQLSGKYDFPEVPLFQLAAHFITKSINDDIESDDPFDQLESDQAAFVKQLQALAAPFVTPKSEEEKEEKRERQIITKFLRSFACVSHASHYAVYSQPSWVMTIKSPADFQTLITPRTIQLPVSLAIPYRDEGFNPSHLVSISNHFSELQSLNWHPRRFQENAKAQFCSAFQNLTTLTSLTVGFERDMDGANREPIIKEVALSILRLPNLTSLDLALRAVGARAVLDSLLQNSKLKSVSLVTRSDRDLNNRLNTVQDSQQLKSILQSNTTLTSLSLTEHALGNSGIQAICEGAKLNTTLKTLQVKGDDIGDIGASHIAGLIGINRTLTSLDFRHHKMTINGAVEILKSLMKNTTVTDLNLAAPALEGIEKRMEAIQLWLQNDTLKEIDIALTYNKMAQAFYMASPEQRKVVRAQIREKLPAPQKQ